LGVVIRWTAVDVGDGRAFLFSPRLGATHLLDVELAQSPLLLALMGLSQRDFSVALTDPAETVTLTGAFEKQYPASAAASMRAGRLLLALYLFFHHFRSVIPLRSALRLAWLVGRHRRTQLSNEQIGHLVWAVEHRLGLSDCYPRALLTACLAGARPTSVSIGILAPTHKLHAWCAIDGAIPYEPVQRHWWYSPLVIADVG
jgi:hypothetical protein